MTPQSSVVRPVSRIGVVLALVPWLVMVLVPYLAGLDFYPGATVVGTLAFVVYRLVVVRRILCADHRRGVSLLRRGRFEEGLRAFEASERVWASRPTLDRYRAVLMGSATPFLFRTLARYNQGYALSRLGRGPEALAALDAVIAEDPSMHLARELRDVLLAGAVLHPEVGAAMRGDAT